MPPKSILLAGASGPAIACRSVEVVREPSARGGYVVRGLTSQGAIVRVPYAEAKVDGKTLPPMTAEQKWDLSQDRPPIAPGEPKPAPKVKG